MGQQCGHSLAGSSGSGFVIRLCNIKVLAGAAVISMLNWGKSHFQVTHMVVGRIQFLMCCWSEGFSFLMALTGGCPHFFAMWVSPLDNSVWKLDSWEWAARREGRMKDRNYSIWYPSQNWHPTTFAIFCSLIACYQVQLTLRRKRSHKGMNTNRWRSLGTILKRLPTFMLYCFVWVKICTLSSCSTF